MKVHKLHRTMVHQMYKWHTINLQCCVCSYDEVHVLVLLADMRNESSYEVSALSVHQPAHDHNSHCRGCRKDEKHNTHNSIHVGKVLHHEKTHT